MISAGQTVNEVSTLQRIMPMVCGTGLSAEENTQCARTLTDNYTQSRNRVPDNLKNIFEGFVEMATKLIFTYCNAYAVRPVLSATEQQSSEAVTRQISQCMYQANSGGQISLMNSNTPINIWGTSFTFPGFLVELANRLSGNEGIVRNPFSDESSTTQPPPPVVPGGRGGSNPWQK